jgi:hypothetical protein
MSEQLITITKKEYLSLCDDHDWRAALENGGVDNWEGYHESLKQSGYFNKYDEPEFMGDGTFADSSLEGDYDE